MMWGAIASPAADSADEWGVISSSSSSSSNSHHADNHPLRPSQLSLWVDSGNSSGGVATTALCQSLRRPPEIDDNTDKFVDHFLGPLPPPSGTKTMEATLLGMSRWKLSDEFLTLSAATNCSVRLWVGGLLRQVHTAIDNRKYIPKICGSFLMSDETVLPSGRHAWQAKLGEHKQKNEAGPLKMIQHEILLGMHLTEASTGKACMWTVPVCVPLQCADRCTGEVLHALWESVMDIPHWKELCEKFPHVFQCRTLDRAASNWRAHRMLQESYPDSWHMWLSCDSHLVSTVTGRSYAAVSAMITGAEIVTKL